MGDPEGIRKNGKYMKKKNMAAAGKFRSRPRQRPSPRPFDFHIMGRFEQKFVYKGF